MNTVYILRCADGSLYTGWTTDIERRLLEHNAGKRGSRYTRAHRPVEMAYTEAFESRKEAMRREAQIKKLSREQKLELIAKTR